MDQTTFDRSSPGDAEQMQCAACKSPVALVAEQGMRRAALIEDGVTLCDVCAPEGNMQRLGRSR